MTSEYLRRPGSLYAYRVRLPGRGGVVLWLGGAGDAPDQVLTLAGPDGRRVPLFTTVRQARVYAARRGRRLAAPEANTLDLARVHRWLTAPPGRPAPAAPVLDAWNFFEDLARGLQEPHRLPPQGPVHDSAYDRLLAAAPATWTPAELTATRTFLTAGLTLWTTCPLLPSPRIPRPGRVRRR